LVIVSPEIVTLETMTNWFPLIVSKFAPGPLIVRFLLITSEPLVSVIVCPLSEESKLMVSPEDESVIA
jgi:hypothetical protein